MSKEPILGLAALILFIGLMILFASTRKRWPVALRSIKGFEALGIAIERAVEAGKRVHLSLGSGSVIGSDSAAAFAGLSVLRRVASATILSDKPAIVTTGDGAMTILAQDMLRTSYQQARVADRYRPVMARMLGPTPFSYVANMPDVLANNDVAVHILNGSFGSEGALAAAFGESEGLFVLGGADDVRSQAILYATAGHPLIGEEVFAGGAYLNAGPMHRASLQAQDIVRILVVAFILIGTLLRTLGVGQ